MARTKARKAPPVAERWNFLSHDEYERLPTASWFDVQRRIIPNHLDLPSHLRKMQPTPLDLVQRIIRLTQRTKRREKQKELWQAPLPPPSPPVLHAHEDFFPDCPGDWIDVTEEASHDHLLPTHVTNIASRTIYALAEASGAVLQNAPNNIKQAVILLVYPHCPRHRGSSISPEPRHLNLGAQKIAQQRKH